MNEFIPGVDLSRRFFFEVVRPILDDQIPSLKYTAGLFGSGSEVLGFDTPMSTDHDWGPRLILLLDQNEESFLADRQRIDTLLRDQLPGEFLGFSTNFSPPDPTDNGTQLLEPPTDGPINHRIQIESASGIVSKTIGFKMSHSLTPVDWLTFSQQKLLELTAGALFHDGLNFQETRQRFAFYPRDVWLYLLACRWQRVGQEEHLMGRAGTAGDEIGSALIGARLVQDLMMLCFLMEKRYAPYAKWFGSAFRRLESAAKLSPILKKILTAADWRIREEHLVEAYAFVVTRHNDLGITKPMSTRAQPFFSRPFKVIHQLNAIADAILAQIKDPDLKRIATDHRIGGVNTFSDNTDLLSHLQYRPALKKLYD